MRTSLPVYLPVRIAAGSLFAVLLAGCGGPEEPPPRPVVRKPVPLQAPPAPPALPAAPPPPAVVAPEKGPETGTEFDPAISSSCFSLRTMDHLKADVFINGHLQSKTTCLWSATPNTAFDPKIPVPVWPPPGAKFCGSGLRKRENGAPCSSIELYLSGGQYELEEFAATRATYPHLVDGEQILYVRVDWGGRPRTGALRLRVVGEDGALYRWVDYIAYASEEDENASLFRHALWFYACRPE
jgi:hypothetical protein